MTQILGNFFFIIVVVFFFASFFSTLHTTVFVTTLLMPTDDRNGSSSSSNINCRIGVEELSRSAPVGTVAAIALPKSLNNGVFLRLR